MQSINRWLVLCMGLFVSSCSTTNQAYYETLKIAFSDKGVAAPSIKTLSNINADLAWVTFGDRAPVTMALAYIEDGQHKWVSRDGYLLVFQNGILMRSAGFEQDVLYSFPIPMLTKSTVANGTISFSYTLDIEGAYNLQIVSEMGQGEQQQLTLWDNVFLLDCFSEHVQLLTPIAGAIHTEWTNTYCFDADSGQLLKSDQLFSPFSDRIVMVYLSRAARVFLQKEEPL